MADAANDAATGRARVMAAMRRALGVTGDEPERRAAVAARLSGHARHLVPRRAAVSGAERLDLFRRMAEATQTTVAEVDTAADVPSAVADYLRTNNLPARIRRGADPVLATMPWHEVSALEVTEGPARADDLASLSHAFAAVAETGTLILTSGPDNPTTLNFLPDNHIVVVEASRVVGAYEDAWDRLRAAYGEAAMPRTVNMITGPSRTADIEQTIQLGAHGPRRLHVILVRNGGPSSATA